MLPVMKPEVADEISARLRLLGDPEKAHILQGFFKTGPGEYAEGDRFLGLKVPQVRLLLREYRGLTPTDALPLLASPIHEERLFALLALVRCFEKGFLKEHCRVMPRTMLRYAIEKFPEEKRQLYLML